MKKYALLPIIATIVLLLVCQPASFSGQNRNFIAVLSGDQENPPNDSQGRGVAIFHLSKDGSELEYKLIVANIENVVFAHIHLAPVGVNGPVVAFLFENVAAAGSGRSDGVLAEGTITSADLVGPLAGMELSDLIDAMRAGGAYVNVHTATAFPPSPPFEPGNLPAGEIRGQIR